MHPGHVLCILVTRFGACQEELRASDGISQSSVGGCQWAVGHAQAIGDLRTWLPEGLLSGTRHGIGGSGSSSSAAESGRLQVAPTRWSGNSHSIATVPRHRSETWITHDRRGAVAVCCTNPPVSSSSDTRPRSHRCWSETGSEARHDNGRSGRVYAVNHQRESGWRRG